MRYTISFALASLVAGPTLAEVPSVVTDIAPVQSLVSMVMGDLGTPALLLDKGADPHDFQLRPSQARAVAGAGLVVWIGPAMSPWLDRALDGTGTKGAQLALLTAPGTRTLTYAGANAGEDQEGEGHEGTNPHAWLDPQNAEVWLGLIAAELSRLDPANAATYAANADTARKGIDTLDRAVAAQLATVKDRPFVVFHDAFGYFAAHYGLSLAGAISPGDATSPGAARLRDLTARAADTVCIFPEVNHDADLSAQMAGASGAKLGAAMDPEGVSLTPGPTLYATLMTGLADTLADCLAQ